MALLSKIKSAVSKTVNSIGSTIKSAFTGGSSNTASAINALQPPAKGSFVASQQKPYTGQGQNTTKDSLVYGVSGIASNSGSGNLLSNTLNKVSGGSSPTPTSFKSLMTPAVGGAYSATGAKSDYSSPSYSNLSSSRFATSSPITTTANAGQLSTGNQTTNIRSAAPINYQGTAIDGNVSVGGEPTTGYIPTVLVTGVTGEETGKDKPKSPIETLIASLRKPASDADSYAKAQNESGLFAAQQQVANSQNEINGITAKMNTDLLEQRRAISENGGTEEGFGGISSRITRDATIRLLPLQAQLANDQGNLELAESRLDTLFKIYSKDAQSNVDYYNSLVTLEYENATASQKRQFEEQSKSKEFEKSLIKDNINYQQSIALQALKDRNIRLYKAVTSVIPPTNQDSPVYSRDKQNYINDINEAVGKYGGGTAGNIGGNLSSISQSVVANPSLFYNFTPTQKGQIVSELQAGGYDISALQNTKLSSGQQDDIAQMNTVKSSIDKVLGFNGDGILEGIGAYTGNIKSIGAQFGIGSEEGKSVRAEIGNIKGTIAKLRGGTSFTANEEKLLDTYVPSINDSPDVAINKLNNLKDFIERKNADLLSSAQLNATTGQIKKKGEKPFPTQESKGTSNSSTDYRSKYGY